MLPRTLPCCLGKRTHSERSSSKYLNSQWWRGFHLNPSIYGKHTHPLVCSDTFSPWCWQCFGMRFIATQRAVAGVEKPPANETERRGGGTIVAFPPALFFNLNNICTLGEGCENGMDRGSKAESPKARNRRKKKKKRSQGLNLALVQGGLHHRFQKHIFFFSVSPATAPLMKTSCEIRCLLGLS